MHTRHLLHSVISEPPEKEVRHLILDLTEGSGEARLIRLTSGTPKTIATGSQYEMSEKANAMAREWTEKEGFRFLAADLPAFEPLRHTVTLATMMGYTVIYDTRFKNEKNLTGAVPLLRWQGLNPKNGGEYSYAYDGTTITARPNVPRNHGLNMRPRTSEETIAVLNQAMQLQNAVGPTLTFSLG